MLRGVRVPVAILLAAIAAIAYWHVQRAQEWAKYSALASLASQAQARLDDFHCETGAFPPNLHYLQFDYNHTDGATPFTLDELSYDSDGQTYQLGFSIPNGDHLDAKGLPPASCPVPAN